MNLFFKSMIAIVIVGSSFAFTSIQNEGLEVTYGVSADDPSSIELRLNKDFSFNYQDFSNPKQKIKVQGTYTLKNRKVQLTVDTPIFRTVSLNNKFTVYDTKKVYDQVQDPGGIGLFKGAHEYSRAGSEV